MLIQQFFELIILQFGKVFVINLPERTDKLDAITLSAAITEFDFDVVKGVKPSEVADKAIPPGMDRFNIMGGENSVGAWRAELNAVRRIVEEKLPSALILEDDVDWDVTLKDQLHDFARGSRFITGEDPHNISDTISPYGDDWDVIWLGHCGVTIWPHDSRRYVITNDPTVPPTHELFANDGPGALPDLSEYGNPATRIVFKSGWTLGSWAYAVSYSGALKIVNELGLTNISAAFDVDLGYMCRDGKINCISVHPPLFGSHKAAGNAAKNSDIVSSSSNDKTRQRPFTYNIAKSVRLNMHHLVYGELDQVSNQFRDMPELKGPMTRVYEM